MQGGGEPTGAFLPNWLSGYAFLFPASTDLQRALQNRAEVRHGGLDAGLRSVRSSGRVIAERIALNAHDAGLTLQPSNPSSKAPVISGWYDPAAFARCAVALANWRRLWDCQPPSIDGNRPDADLADSLYAAENALLQSQRVIPLLYLRTAAALNPRVMGWRKVRMAAGVCRTCGWKRGSLDFRRKLLLVFALTVVVSVGAVTWIVSSVTRRAFEQANEDQTAALIAQFRREFSRRGEEVARRLETVAASESGDPHGPCSQPRLRRLQRICE